MTNQHEYSDDLTDLHDDLRLTLEQLGAATPYGRDWVLALLDEAVITPFDGITPVSDTDALSFGSVQLSRVRRAARLRRDFDASPQAIGLILTLLDELNALRQYKRQSLGGAFSAQVVTFHTVDDDSRQR